MTIKVYKDRIEIGAYTLTATPTGASFNGSIAVSKLGSAFRVGQGKSYGFKHGINASLGPDEPLIYPNRESMQYNSYKFSFASGAAQNLGSFGLINAVGTTYYSSETHGFSKTVYNQAGTQLFPTPGITPPSWPNSSYWVKFNCFFTPLLAPSQDLSEFPYTDSRINNLRRFSFASGGAAEEIGVLSDRFWPTNNGNKVFFNSINSVSYNSTLHGYHKYNHRNNFSAVTKFSFTNAASRALIFNNSLEDMASYSSYPSIGSQLRTPYQRFIGAQLSNNDYGYSVDVSNNPLSSGIGFYSKFPFSSEVQLISIPSGFTNNQYMTGITGPMAGYWHGGLSNAPTILNNNTSSLTPILPTSGGAQNGNYKFPFATDVLSALTGVPYLGLGHAGTASDTKGHLLNGFISGSFTSRERTVYRGPTFLNVPLDSYSGFLETNTVSPGTVSPPSIDPDFASGSLILSAGFFSNWNRLEYPFASETTIAGNPTFDSNNITFNNRIRSHLPSPFGGTSQY